MVQMIYCYGACGQNLAASVRMYNNQHPARRLLSPQTLGKIIRRFNDTGSVMQRPRPGRPRTATDEANSTAILAAIAVNAHTSTRAIAHDSGGSKSSVWNVLHTHKFHPYHVHCIRVSFNRTISVKWNFVTGC